MIQIPEFTMEATFKDLLEPAMQIAKTRDMDLAAEYRQKYVTWLMAGGRTYEEALAVFHSNVGYYAGYYDYEMMQAVKEVFGSRHPVFGGQQ